MNTPNLFTYQLNDRDHELITRVVRNHMLVATAQQRSYRSAYDLLIDTHYSVDALNEGTARMERRPINAHNQPTFEQFKYVARKMSRSPEDVAKRAGSLAFSQRHRAALDSPALSLMGPGAVYQIDATKLDLGLASAFDRRTAVGRPWLYVVRDWWCGIIVGILVTLLSPSYATFGQAMFNAAISKQRLASQYGITFSEEEYYASGICGTALLDRGTEFTSLQSTGMVGRTGITLANLPPRRPEWKGLIERVMEYIKSRAIARLPGALTREQRDRYVEATPPILTLIDIWQILLHTTCDFNHEIVSREDCDEHAARASAVPLTRQSLYNWGLAHYGNASFAASPEALRLRFFPHVFRAPGTRGISVNNLYYESAIGFKNGWFLRSTNRKQRHLHIAWNPQNVGEAWVIDPSTGQQHPLRLRRKYQKYEGLSVTEWLRYHRAMTKQDETAASTRQSRSSKTETSINEIVSNAYREERRVRGEAIEYDESPTTGKATQRSMAPSTSDELMAQFDDAALNGYDWIGSDDISPVGNGVMNYG